MSEVEVRRTDHLDWAVAGRPMPGEPVSGDAATVQIAGARCILAVVDGAGHGAEAADAAERALRAVEAAEDASVDDLLSSAHQALERSRGAALTVAILDGASGTMWWAGIGDVDGVVLRNALGVRATSQGVLLRGGVLGHLMPDRCHPVSVELEDGDCIVLATDGIGVDLADVAHRGLTVDRLAATLLDDHAVSTDDALVLVARYRAVPFGARSAGSTTGSVR